jgi:hypothetical protein
MLQCYPSTTIRTLTNFLKETNQHWWFVPVIPATQEVEVGRLFSEACLGKNGDPI